MAVYKDDNTKTWYVSVRYSNWQGEKTRKVKRGFKTKKEAQEWEQDFLNENAGSLEMTFAEFVQIYEDTYVVHLEVLVHRVEVDEGLLLRQDVGYGFSRNWVHAALRRVECICIAGLCHFGFFLKCTRNGTVS